MKFKTQKLKKDYLKRIFLNKYETYLLSKSALIKNKLLPLDIRSHIFNNNFTEDHFAVHDFYLRSAQHSCRRQNRFVGPYSRELRQNLLACRSYGSKTAQWKQYFKHLQVNFHSFHEIEKSTTRIRNRCIKTGRGRGILSKFGVSRLVFRNLVDNGYIPGFKSI